MRLGSEKLSRGGWFVRDLVVRDLNEKCSFVLWYSTGWVVLYSLRTLKHLSKTVGI